jgi:anti-sigma28 factor (negative regulator of flagellin synthesis)
LNWGTGVTVRRPASAPAAPLPAELPQSRREKVLAIRQQIADGTYDPDTRINAILDRLLKVLVA